MKTILKLLFAFIVCSITVISIPTKAFAAESDIPGVSMTGFEQSYLSLEAYISLKNNLPDTIYSVTYSIEYLKMNNTPMDYEEYTAKVMIPPGRTKRVELPAYGYDSNYEYFKSSRGLGLPLFKVNYKYISSSDINPKAPTADTVNIVNDKANISNQNSDKSSLLSKFPIVSISLLIIILIIGAYIGLYVLVAVMAKHRGRNPAIWILLSLLASPLLIAIILLAIGKSNNSYFQ